MNEAEQPSEGRGGAMFVSLPPIFEQFLRYLLVGGLAFVVDFAALGVSREFFALSLSAAVALGFLAGTIANYVLATRWVFRSHSVSSTSAEFVIFVAIGVVGLLLSELSMWMLSTKAGLHYGYAKVIVTGIVLVWNFGARKLALFRDG